MAKMAYFIRLPETGNRGDYLKTERVPDDNTPWKSASTYRNDPEHYRELTYREYAEIRDKWKVSLHKTWQVTLDPDLNQRVLDMAKRMDRKPQEVIADIVYYWFDNQR